MCSYLLEEPQGSLARRIGKRELQARRCSTPLQELLDTLGSTSGGPARENAAIVLSAVARSNTCPLTHALGEPAAADLLHWFIVGSNVPFRIMNTAHVHLH